AFVHLYVAKFTSSSTSAAKPSTTRRVSSCSPPPTAPRARRPDVSSLYAPCGPSEPIGEMFMTSSSGMSPFGEPLAAASSLGQVVEAKLHRPPRRDSWVQRARLLEA